MQRLNVALFGAIVCLVGSTVFAEEAIEYAPKPDITGRWSGYVGLPAAAAGTVMAGGTGALSIEITAQHGRSVAGGVCIAAAACIPVTGTVTRSGEVTIAGIGDDGTIVEVQGDPVDRTSGPPGAIVGQYRILYASGATAEGGLAAVHRTANGVTGTDLAGTWGGEGTPRGSASASPAEFRFSADGTGALSGSVQWDTAAAPSPIVGQTIHAATDLVFVVAPLNDAILVASMSSSLSTVQRRLVGTYALVAASGSGGASFGRLTIHFGKFPSYGSEAKSNLKALFTAEKAYLAEKDVYSTRIGDVGFQPERANRYRYVLTANPASLEDRSTKIDLIHLTDEGVDADRYLYPSLVYPTITQGPCIGTPAWGITTQSYGYPVFTAAAYASFDGGKTYDIWTISTESRLLSGTCDAAGVAYSGEPVHEQIGAL